MTSKLHLVCQLRSCACFELIAPLTTKCSEWEWVLLKQGCRSPPFLQSSAYSARVRALQFHFLIHFPCFTVQKNLFYMNVPTAMGKNAAVDCSFTFIFVPWWCRGDLTSSYSLMPPRNLVGSCKLLCLTLTLSTGAWPVSGPCPSPPAWSPACHTIGLERKPGLGHWAAAGSHNVHVMSRCTRTNPSPASVPCSSFNLFSQRGIKPFRSYIPLK